MGSGSFSVYPGDFCTVVLQSLRNHILHLKQKRPGSLSSAQRLRSDFGCCSADALHSTQHLSTISKIQIHCVVTKHGSVRCWPPVSPCPRDNSEVNCTCCHDKLIMLHFRFDCKTYFWNDCILWPMFILQTNLELWCSNLTEVLCWSKTRRWVSTILPKETVKNFHEEILTSKNDSELPIFFRG